MQAMKDLADSWTGGAWTDDAVNEKLDELGAVAKGKSVKPRGDEEYGRPRGARKKKRR
ncbi:MAG: hypothetical protein HY908_32660 [Myxococcales bacterium]|nr:hypothetical protein [Myxococcales bacterium]